MKTLKESILSSTKTGKEKILNDVKEWFENTEWYKIYAVSRSNIQVSAVGKKYKINIVMLPDDVQKIPHRVAFTKKDNGSDKMKYPIHSVCINERPCNIEYRGLKFKDSSEFVETLSETLALFGCEIDTIDSLPNGCNSVSFNSYNNTGRFNPTTVNNIKNISVNSIYTDTIFGGLSCMLNDINNIRVRKEMYITDGMLGWYSLEKDKKTFTKTASDMLTDFFDKNKVKRENCLFIPTNNLAIGCDMADMAKIKFDEESKRWKITKTISFW